LESRSVSYASLREIQLSDASRLSVDLRGMRNRPSQLNGYLAYLSRRQMRIRTYIGADLRFIVGWSVESEESMYGPPLPLARHRAELSQQIGHCYRILQRSRPGGSRSRGMYVFLLNRCWAQSFEAIGARVFSTPEDDNYVYRARDIGEMRGPGLKTQRRNVQHFERRFGELEERELDADGAMDAEAVVREWTRQKLARLAEHPERPLDFYRALRDDHSSTIESIRNLSHVPLQGRLYYLDRRPIAFIAGLPLGEDTFLMLSQKNRRLRGLSETVFQRFARSLMDRYDFLNDGSDAGIASLRSQKRHWRPCGILHTYGAFFRGSSLEPASRP
jgi:hypothetical protein